MNNIIIILTVIISLVNCGESYAGGTRYKIAVYFSSNVISDNNVPTYTLLLKTPFGNEGQCMHVWQVPRPSVSMNYNKPMYDFYIEDKEELLSCNGSDKFNVWRYDILKAGSVVSSGSFKFLHNPHNYGGVSIQSNSDSVLKAYCLTDKTDSNNSRISEDCLNKSITGFIEKISIVINI